MRSIRRLVAVVGIASLLVGLAPAGIAAADPGTGAPPHANPRAVAPAAAETAKGRPPMANLLAQRITGTAGEGSRVAHPRGATPGSAVTSGPPAGTAPIIISPVVRPAATPSTPATPAGSPAVATTLMKGTVKNKAGTPLAGIQVSMMRVDTSTTTMATTSATGAFSAGVVGAGHAYVISYHDPAGTYYDGYYADGGGVATDSNHTLWLTVYSTPIVANATLKNAYTIHGTIVDNGSAPLAGIQLDFMTTTGYSIDSTTTDGSGIFSIKLPAGPLNIHVGSMASSYAAGWWNGSEPVGAQADALVYNLAADAQVDMTLPPTPTLSGHAANAITGANQSGVFVTAYDASNTSAGSGSSNGAGLVSFSLQPGRYTFKVQVAGLTGWFTWHGWSARASEASVIPVTVAGLSGMDFLVPDAATISGAVIYSYCDISNVLVDIYDAGGFVASTSLGFGGTYNFTVANGVYNVFFFDPYGYCASGWAGPSGLVTAQSSASSYTVGLGSPAHVEVSMSAASWITGKIIYNGNKNWPADPMRVEVFSGSDYYIETESAMDGTYWVPVAPGTYTMFVDEQYNLNGWYASGVIVPNSTGATALVVGATNRTANINITSNNAVDIHFTVTGPDGKLRKGVTVAAYKNGEAVKWGTTDNDGFVNLVVRPGTYTVAEWGGSDLLSGWLGAGGWTAEEADAAPVVAVADIWARFTVPAGHHVRGRVTGAGAAGLRGVSVQLYTNGVYWDVTHTGIGGLFDLLEPPAAYQLAFYDATDTWGTAWYSGGGAVRSYMDSSDVVVAGADVTGLNVTLSHAVAPDAPTGVTGGAFDGGAIVSWQAPASDGWKPVILYTATATPGGATCTSDGALGCLMTGLSNTVPYTFHVTAANVKGTSGSSAESGTATPTVGLPVPPPQPSVRDVSGAAVVTFSASAAAGVTGYRVTASPGGATCTVTLPGNLGCTIFGLDPSTVYTFTVAAVAGATTGPESIPSDPWQHDVWAPTTTTPVAALRIGAALSGTALPITLTWRSNDPGDSGIQYYQVERSTNGGATWVTLPGTYATPSANLTATAAGTVRYGVRAVDWGGNTGAWMIGPAIGPSLVQQTSALVKRVGVWSLASALAYSGASSRYSVKAASYVTFKTANRSIALVSTKAKKSGKVKVYVDGVYVTTVDLYRSSTQNRVLVWGLNFHSYATRTIKLVVVGTSGRPRVDVDAFAILK